MLEILNEDYITAARSYGLKEKTVLWSYALKNSIGPTSTVVALSIGYTLVNTFLTESILYRPGIGSYISSAVIGNDYPAIWGYHFFGIFLCASQPGRRYHYCAGSPSTNLKEAANDTKFESITCYPACCSGIESYFLPFKSKFIAAHFDGDYSAINPDRHIRSGSLPLIRACDQ
jgi:hypothetical protein